MAPRVLVCIEDTGVAHVVAARLMRDGVDGVVVDKPNRLVEEAKKGVSALAVQDKYPTGEAAASLLRAIRVARSEAVPAILLVTGEMPQGERHVLEKQYRVRDFLTIAASPIKIADALKLAAGGAANGEDADVVLHEDEVKNEFDISVDSVSEKMSEQFDGAFNNDDVALKTVEVSAADLARMRQDQLKDLRGGIPKAPPSLPITRPTATLHDTPAAKLDLDGPDTVQGTRVPAPQPVTQEGGAAPPPPSHDPTLTIEGMFNTPSDLSQLPAPGGDMDLDFAPKPTTKAQAPSPVSAISPGDAEAAGPNDTKLEPDKPTPPAPSGDEGDPVQIQELQKTQNELKKALLAERKKTEAAQKRVEELEQRIAKGGDAKERTPSTGVPTEGVFEDLRYPALLARCRQDAFTGSIQMQSGGATRTVYLRDGLPIGFHSSEPGERIGKVLVTQNRISESQYGSATVRSVERNMKLTDALVELGYMDAETIAVEQRNLTRDQIIQSFELVQGRFTVQAGSAPDAQTATFDFGPGEIYVQGFRRYAPANEMMASYETLRDKYLIANARLASYRPKLGLAGEDERLLRLLGEALTVEEAVERAQLQPEHAARLLSALQALELVEEWSPGVEQFRSRIRHERQRHAEEISNVHAESKRREDRLIEAFEGALKKVGVNVSIASSIEPEPAKKSPSSFSSTTVGGGFSSQPLGGGAVTLGPGPSMSSAPPQSVSPPVVVPTPQPSSSASRNPISSVSVGSSPPASSSPASASSTLSVAAVAQASSNGDSGKHKDPPPSMSVADVKYREGVEQASQNRLDEAEVTLREAVRLDASKPEYLTSLARVLLANPRYERAGTLPVVRSLLDRAVQIAPDFHEAVELHAQVVREMSG